MANCNTNNKFLNIGIYYCKLSIIRYCRDSSVPSSAYANLRLTMYLDAVFVRNTRERLPYRVISNYAKVIMVINHCCHFWQCCEKVGWSNTRSPTHEDVSRPLVGRLTKSRCKRGSINLFFTETFVTLKVGRYRINIGRDNCGRW